ncbi:MAG TPA: hemolysin family protein [Accumulibacter sp.]|uniref:hemolysin family protein n=1 Tax=Accumulibacter sp. TaxID=2053492 RepID=UPI002D1BCC9D|nr:hemolysin family protein [Accumulibacter sp.]HRF74509.1 hemolysin family protein [Accumulibacter sp.]
MEHTNLYLNLVLIFVFIAGNAFFVGSEIAISSARRSRIKQLAEMGDKRAARVEMLHDEPERFYSVTQVGITLVSLGLGAVGMETISTLTDSTFVAVFTVFGDGEAVHKAAHTMSYAFAFVVISFLHVVAGELAPKVLAFHKAEQLSMSVGWTVNALYLTFRPLIYVMKLSSDALLRLFGQRNLEGHGESHFTMSVDEIRMILSASEKEGTLAPEETQMIRGVFKLDEHTVREAMVPRTRIRALTHQDTLADALRVFRDVPHARFPICDQSLDRITGVVAIKELLTVMAESSGQTLEEVSRRPVSDFAQAPFIVPNSKSLSDLLKEFKHTRQQMAIVIDEYGGTEGIITLEDILEEIVGEYEDEFTRQGRRVRKLVGSQYEIDASIRVTDLEALLDFPFPIDDDYVTLAGLFYKKLGNVPKVGDSVDLEGGRLTVLEMDNHRITLLRFEDLAVGEDGVVRLVEASSAADAATVAASD